MAMTLRLTEEQDARLTALAQAQGLSKHATLLRLIDTASERAARQQWIDRNMDDVLERDAELLRRLAQ
ncbi:MAG: CopG family transcriptional regulator [Mobilicoccus sp.]|nr:CopG family transcriptional regulator [Mobilicoccus sp.]